MAAHHQDMKSYVVATSTLGPLEIHRSGCAHTKRLYAAGGGVLADFDLIGEARRFAEAEVGRPAKIAPCVSKPPVHPQS